ncbi:MAG: hypothetical protein J6N32_00160 [Clostridia bacterium]|nr:hypothetical protein [Clostridia bacterium]
MKISMLTGLLLLWLLISCESTAEETRPPDTASQILQETAVPPETVPEEPADPPGLSDHDYEILAEGCMENSAELLKKRKYVLTGDAAFSVVRYGEVKSQYAFVKKLEEMLIEHGGLDEDSSLILVEVPTDQGTIPLVYSLGMMLVTEEPESVERSIPELEITDTSLPAELDGAAPVTVHDIRKYMVGSDKGWQNNSLLFRITSPEELAQIREELDYFWNYDHDEINFSQYDDAWFETRDLYIADMGAGGSEPDRVVMKVTDGNRLLLGYEAGGEPVTDDIVGRLVFVEVNKGDILTWEAADDRYYTAEAFAEQVEQWILDDCWQSARSRISREDTFVTGLPEITYPTLAEIPEHLRGEVVAEKLEHDGLTDDSVLIRMDIPAADGMFTALFTGYGDWLGFMKIQ